MKATNLKSVTSESDIKISGVNLTFLTEDKAIKGVEIGDTSGLSASEVPF